VSNKNGLRNSDVSRRETTRSLKSLGLSTLLFWQYESHSSSKNGGLEMAILSGKTPQHSTQSQHMLVIGNVVITTQDKQFFEGFLYGFQNFQKGTVPTDQDLYMTCLKIIDVQKSGKYQSGLIVGEIAAMFDVQGDTEIIDIASQESMTT
jgi:hypothetical protein